MEMEQTSVADKLTKYFQQKDFVLCAILYGSFATGKSSLQSDIDIGVFCANLLTAQEKILPLKRKSQLNKLKRFLKDE